MEKPQSAIISIIVPVYNLGEYLRGCMESILRSTVSDYEIILVDDGSTDGSGELCDGFARQDSRVRVIHKPNAGVARARNSGLEAATGEYVMFVDGDDQIHPRMIEWLLEAMQSGDYDLAMVHGVKMKEPEARQRAGQGWDDQKDHNLKTVSQDEYMRKIYALDFQYHVVWGKLYRKSLIEGLYFKDTAAEDQEWLNRMALRMKSAVLVHKELYYYIQRMDSLIHNWYSLNTLDRVYTYLDCLEEIPEEKREYRAMCLKAMYTVMLSFRRHFRHTPLEGEAKARCKEIFRKTIREFLGSDIGAMSKLRSVMGYYLPQPYDAIMSAIEAWHKR